MVMNFRVPFILEISWVAKRRVAYREKLSSMELASQLSESAKQILKILKARE